MADPGRLPFGRAVTACAIASLIFTLALWLDVFIFNKVISGLCVPGHAQVPITPGALLVWFLEFFVMMQAYEYWPRKTKANHG